MRSSVHRAGTQLLILVTLGILRPGVSNAFDAIPYRSPDWRYLVVPYDDPVGQAFMDPFFNDAAWPIGTAAFGNALDPNCALNSSVNTYWPSGTEMLFRKLLVFDSFPIEGVPSTIASERWTVWLATYSDAKVYANHTLLLDVTHSGCPVLDEFHAVVPPAVFEGGYVAFTVRAVDHAVRTFADLRVTVDFVTVPTERGTWSGIKAMYRDASALRSGS